MSRPFQSLRWRLQLWHGLMLLAVLAAFGLTAFHLARDSRLRRVDQDLQRRLSAVMSSIRPLPGREAPPFGPPNGLRSLPDTPPGPDANGGPGPTPFHMPPDQQGLFAGPEGKAFYFVVWLPRGEVLQQSAGAPPVPPPRPGAEPAREFLRTRGLLRELVRLTPPGLAVVVGRSIEPDLEDLRRLAWLLALAGAGVLGLGLSGGWWLASRAIRPISEISATARDIAAGNWQRRISLAETDSELGQLAQVLNSTFDRLADAFTRQAQFTADASHELRTPVSVILSQAQTALARERPVADYRESLEACQRAAQRMRHLIESLLVLARLDSGEEPPRRQPCALEAVAAEVAGLLEPLAAERQVSVQTQLEPAVCLGNPEQLGQVVTNLVSNAIHYNRPGGQVRLETVTQGESAVVTVSDTGLGISSEDLPHIFERFYRADKSRARARGRTGLGLAIARAIVEAHGGTIEAASQLGQGSTFTVRLPRGCLAPPPRPPQSP